MDEDDVRTASQREWADWSAHGYRKLYQPRSMLWFGGIVCVLLIAMLLRVVTGHLPLERRRAARRRPLHR